MERHASPSLRRPALVALSLLSHGVVSAEIRRKDGIHRAPKVEALVTPAPHLGKREQTQCPTSYSLCAPNLSGGCCGNGYSCAVDSCYATTRGPVTCGGREGFYACGIEDGGGCCPVGSKCDREEECIPAPGVSYSHECSASSYLCPQSLGYGCCEDGMVCGKNRCYSTDASTFVLTRTITTTVDDSEETVTTTVTTVSTPDTDDTDDEMPSDQALQKFYPTAVPKVDPVITDDDEGGLTKAQIGGVVGGSIAFLLIIVVAAFFIIRRLNDVAKAVEESKTDPEPDPNSRRESPEFVKPRDAEAESVSTSAAPPYRDSHHSRTDSDSEAATLFGLLSPNTPASSEGASRRQSNRSSTSDGPMTVSSWRNDSVRTAGRRDSGSDGFATPISPPSEPAELEAGDTRAELEGNASPTPELPSPVPSSAWTSRVGKDGPGHGHKRSVSAATPQLDVVVEDGEFHGYYGPLDKVAGQTSAGPAEGQAT